MRKFLQLARMTLKEDIVVFNDIEIIEKFSIAPKINANRLAASGLQQPRNACPGTT